MYVHEAAGHVWIIQLIKRAILKGVVNELKRTEPFTWVTFRVLFVSAKAWAILRWLGLGGLRGPMGPEQKLQN